MIRAKVAGGFAINDKAAPRRERLWRFAAVCLAAVVTLEAVWLALSLIEPNPGWDLGQDYRFYRDLGARWLADGTYYLPSQLEGTPYVARLMVDVLYPPNALILFVPFVVLPAVLWWAVPIAVTVYVLYRLQPAPWAWVVMLLLLVFPRAIGAYLFGNTDIWAAAGIFAGLRWGWPAAFLFLKPVYAPFALIGIRRGSWWLAFVAIVSSSLALAPMWLDYVAAMRNLVIPLDYSLGSVPLLLVPIVAWLGRQAPPAIAGSKSSESVKSDENQTQASSGPALTT